MCLFFLVTVEKLQGWKRTLKTEVGRVRKSIKGKSGQAPEDFSERMKFCWNNLNFLLDTRHGQTYTDDSQVGICIQLYMTCYWIILVLNF